jgi:hypothetical protein
MSIPANPTAASLARDDTDERREDARAEEDRADQARTEEVRADETVDADETADAEEVRADETADAEVVHSGTQDRTVPVDTEDVQMLPGGEPPPPAPRLWSDDDARGLRERLKEAQLHFLDDPRAAVEAADALVTEAIDSFTARLAEQRTTLGSWRDNGADDTEQLRVVVQRYRDFLERVLAL